ncbi:hypothetical protein Q5752_004832 [Cryptotrichosporon argae]
MPPRPWYLRPLGPLGAAGSSLLNVLADALLAPSDDDPDDVLVVYRVDSALELSSARRALRRARTRIDGAALRASPPRLASRPFSATRTSTTSRAREARMADVSCTPRADWPDGPVAVSVPSAYPHSPRMPVLRAPRPRWGATVGRANVVRLENQAAAICEAQERSLALPNE